MSFIFWTNSTLVTGYVLPGSAPKKLNREPKKLFSQHSAFLIDLFDANPSIVLEEAKQRLCKNFIGLKMSIAGLYKHIREKCSISLKQANKYTVELLSFGLPL